MNQLVPSQIAGKDVWVFGSRKGQFFDDNSKYLYQYVLANKPDIFPVWLTKNSIVFDKLTNLGFPVAMVGSDYCNYLMTQAKCAFINIIHLDIDKNNLSPNTKVIQLWHGTPMKHNDISLFKERYDLVSLASKLFMREQTLAPHHLFDFRVTGYPRNDFLLNDELPDLLDKQGTLLLQNKKVITFVPTYNEEKDENKKGDKRGKAYDIWAGLDVGKLNRILETHNAVFVIKLHPLQSPVNCERQAQLVSNTNVFILDANDPFADVYHYLKFTDIMITDYSSILFDYLLLDRPVIFSCFDLETYSQKRNLRFDYETITPGPKTENWHQVLENIEQILNGSDDFKQHRSEVSNIFNYYKDFQSRERIYNLAKNL